LWTLRRNFVSNPLSRMLLVAFRSEPSLSIQQAPEYQPDAPGQALSFWGAALAQRPPQ
jgi:hypothetical protein